MTRSLQLPDLASFCSVFELRANKHCRGVSKASEKWLQESGITLSSMAWSAAKPGLLAAACHPNADPPQLRFITDFLSLLLRHRERVALSNEDAEFCAALSDRLSRVAYRHPGWYMRFAKSQRCYLEARYQFATNAAQGVVPDLESYIEQGRDASGFRMALDLVQYAGDVVIPDALSTDALFAKLHDHACDIAVWSAVGDLNAYMHTITDPVKDIVSCAKGIPSKHDANIVTVLMKERNVSLESAVSSAGVLVKQSVDAFVATEEALLSVREFAADDEVRQYVRGLRDWIAGFVNWLYETELYLGEKGNEVRAFGWVFIPVEA